MLRDEGATHILCSYADRDFRYIIDKAITMGFGVMLDSGAYSAFSRGATITVNEYAACLRDYGDAVDVYVNLDVCDDAEQTARNQNALEDLGFAPMPVYHFGEPQTVLDRLAEYQHIGLGNSELSSQRPQAKFEAWVQRVTMQHPTKRFHAFAVGTFKPYCAGLHSADSTTWTAAARFGRLLGKTGEVSAREKGLFFNRTELLRHNIRALMWQAANLQAPPPTMMPLGFEVAI